MKKKLLGIILATAMVTASLAGCGSGTSQTAAPADSAETTPAQAVAEEEAPAQDSSAGGGKVGVAMPTKDLQRWNQDGSNMEAQLIEAGYEVDIQYASNDISTQVSQIENMINSGCELLVDRKSTR